MLLLYTIIPFLSAVKCPIGTYQISSKCNPCPQKCIQCIHQKNCLQNNLIDLNFQNYLQRNLNSCDPNCFTCVGSYCTICKVGFFDNGSNCTACHNDCRQCTGGTNSDCVACSGNKSLNFITRTCQEPNSNSICHQTCRTCTGSSSNQCLTCGKGRFIQNSQCLKCSSQCVDCVIGQNHCTQCPLGKILSLTFQCQNCSSQCLQCSFLSSKCTKCVNGNTPNSLGICSCFLGCQTCTQVLQLGKCLSCSQNFVLDKGICKPCPQGCSQCRSQYQCDICKLGFKSIKDMCVKANLIIGLSIGLSCLTIIILIIIVVLFKKKKCCFTQQIQQKKNNVCQQISVQQIN